MENMESWILELRISNYPISYIRNFAALHASTQLHSAFGIKMKSSLE